MLFGAGFPELTAVVKQNAGQEEAVVQHRVRLRDGGAAPHHLRGVLKQAAPTGMVVSAGRGGPSESISVLFEERTSEACQPWIGNARYLLLDEAIILLLFVAKIFRTGQQRLHFFLPQQLQLPTLGFQPEGSRAGKRTSDFDKGAGRQIGALPESGVIAPDPKGHAVFGVDQLDDEVGFLVSRGPGHDGFHLGVDLSFPRSIA